jgi:hypothetical protein
MGKTTGTTRTQNIVFRAYSSPLPASTLMSGLMECAVLALVAASGV